MIAGKEWPAKLGHRALTKIAKKAGTGGRLQAALKELEDPALENVPYYIQCMISNGLKGAADDATPPSLNDIADELDQNFSLWADVLTACQGDLAAPETPDEGN